MYLRARGITLDFPVAPLMAGHAALPTGDDLLGGLIRTGNGKTYVRALEDVSIDLRQGDRLALVGHNGSGKSTLLRVLAGIYHPDRGCVEASEPVSGIFNMSLGFRQDATGYRNIVLKGLIAGRTRAEIESALPEISELTGLGPYLDMPLHSYSQGMAMRLAFAVTTAFSDRILIMDEWIGTGDATFREKIVQRMNQFVDSATIVVLASHSANLLRRIANKALWLEQGKVHRFGDCDEVLDEYEAMTAPASAPIRQLPSINRHNGIWLPTLEEIAGKVPPSLAWNIPGLDQERLQMTVRSARSLTETLVCNARGQGLWPLAPWVVSGMRFSLRRENDEEILAEFTMPESDAIL